ncbi:MAG: alpha/beta fold hydrolase [Myxococcota bacterium]
MSALVRDRVRLHYEVAGGGPALLITHGFTGSTADFAKNVDALARENTVITWDLRGHGRSDCPADPAAYSVPLCVADMAALLDAAGAERAVLAGHSLGGFLSLEFHLAQRARVAGLILIDTGPGYRKDEPRAGWNARAEGMARDFEAKGGERALGLARVARGILAQHDARVLESLSAITVPTLIVVGEHDTPFLAGSRYMAEKIPRALLEVIANAAHSPAAEQPDVFSRVVSEFLRATRLD